MGLLSSSALACLTSHRLAAAHDDALIRRLVEGLVNIPKLIARGERVGEISVDELERCPPTLDYPAGGEARRRQRAASPTGASYSWRGDCAVISTS